MARLFRNKRVAFTFLELSIVITLMSVVFLPLGMSGKKLLTKWQYERDVFKLKAQLQQAYNFVLHCDVPAKVTLESTQKGLICSLSFENEAIEKVCLKYAFYPHIKKMQLKKEKAFREEIFFSSSGDYREPFDYTFIGLNENQQMSMIIKGYPHVLEVTKKQ